MNTKMKTNVGTGIVVAGCGSALVGISGLAAACYTAMEHVSVFVGKVPYVEEGLTRASDLAVSAPFMSHVMPHLPIVLIAVTVAGISSAGLGIGLLYGNKSRSVA